MAFNSPMSSLVDLGYDAGIYYSTKLLLCLLFFLVFARALGSLLQVLVRCRLGQKASCFVDVEQALDRVADPLQAAGLRKLFLDSLPAFSFSKQKKKTKSQKMEAAAADCSVCLSEFKENEKCRMLPKCKHKFHTACIAIWLHTHSTCPLCRAFVGFEESLHFFPYMDEEMGFSPVPLKEASHSVTKPSAAAKVNQGLSLRTFSFNRRNVRAFLQQQSFNFSSWQRGEDRRLLPLTATASRKTTCLSANAIFRGRQTPLGAKNDPLFHLNSIQRIVSQGEQRYGDNSAAPMLSSMFTGYNSI